MISIAEILTPAQVNLALVSEPLASGVDEVMGLLREDPHVADWDALHAAVVKRNAPALEAGGYGICIAHGRTNAVRSLVMAVGRSPEGLVAPGLKEPVRLVFVAGIPTAFDSEYLRVVGAIARLCQDKGMLDKLLGVSTPARFIELLASGESRL